VAVYGQDWSSMQPASPGTGGLGFAFVKATEGTTYINPVQRQQAAHARARGLVVGFYHFLWPGKIEAQAAYFVDCCASVPGDLLACDWETTESGTAASGAEKDAFLKAVRRLRPDHQVLLYCNRDFWLNQDTTSYCADGLWISDPDSPPGHPAVSHPWLIHQYSAAGGIDRDIADFSSEAAMRTWARARLATPK
jgi:GH25 family lysozyme M1 (1,4-beta-N-acetylmuramidase)